MLGWFFSPGLKSEKQQQLLPFLPLCNVCVVHNQLDEGFLEHWEQSKI